MAHKNRPQFSHKYTAHPLGLRILDLTKIVVATALISISIPSVGKAVSDTPARSSNPITVQNQKPIAKADFVNLKKSSTAFNCLANDIDPNGDRLTIISASANFGAVAFTPEGLLAYAQDPTQPRADRITYTVTDGRGGFDQGVVEIALP